MTTLTLYHNPQCSKSRAALTLLNELGITTNIILYLEKPLNEIQLRTLAQQLGITSPRTMMRTQESLFQQLQLNHATDNQLFTALAAYPQLLERPIVVYQNRAVIARPIDNIHTLLTHLPI